MIIRAFQSLLFMISNMNQMVKNVADYVGFIKKIMKMMQGGYGPIRKIEVELRQLGDSEAPQPDGKKKHYTTKITTVYWSTAWHVTQLTNRQLYIL